MPVLRNSRHERFSQLVVSGIKPADAYVSLGYSKAGAPQSANNLLKRTDVRERVNEIQSLAAQSAAEEVAFDQKRVLNRLDILSRKAEELGQISAAARCEELIGKHRGMFVDRTALQWDLDPTKMSYKQVDVLARHYIKRFVGDDPALLNQAMKELEAGTLVVELAPPGTPNKVILDQPIAAVVEQPLVAAVPVAPAAPANPARKKEHWEP
jgi:hypothetical protein